MENDRITQDEQCYPVRYAKSVLQKRDNQIMKTMMNVQILDVHGFHCMCLFCFFNIKNIIDTWQKDHITYCLTLVCLGRWCGGMGWVGGGDSTFPM